MARGSDNKAGTSGQGSSNQSSQGFGQAADAKKSSHGRQTGGKPSQPQEKKQSRSASRNDGQDSTK